MNPKMETSAEDEEALSQLASGFKPDIPQFDGRAGSAVIAETGTSSSWGSMDVVCPVPLGIGREFPVLRLYLGVAIGRS